MAGCWLFWRGSTIRASAVVLASAAAGVLFLLMMPEGSREGTLIALAD